ncbi:hypothetical protein [Serratia fonticola]|uniref:hypothetical protein n=1 Tax=Serratia fonticola TaxID=47917 RepID=UPI00141A21F7|nr:hypothetical protein [Serratia fonticola]
MANDAIRDPPAAWPYTVIPIFYTDTLSRLGESIFQSAMQIGQNICPIYAQFFELDLKINISLFTKYEINVLVCQRPPEKHRLDDRHGSPFCLPTPYKLLK